MNYVNANLTPGRFFINIQLQKVIAELQEIGYSLAYEFTDFTIFKNSDLSSIKIRRDGSISCKMQILDVEEVFVKKLIKELTLIKQTLNPVYSDLIDIDNIFLYWSENYDFSNFIFKDYNVQNSKIYDGKYVSILNRKVCYSC